MDELKRMVHDLQKFMDKTCFVKVQQDHDTSKNGFSEDIESTSCFSKNKGSKASKENVKATKSSKYCCKKKWNI